MRVKRILMIVLGLAALGAAGFAVWVLRLPPAVTGAVAPPVFIDEVRATLAALQPPKRNRPLVAIVGINDATETTDYLMTYGILRRADVADVELLSTAPGPVELYPALTVVPHATIAAFDARHPDGADYVIVPAMSRDDDPAALEWIRSQAGKGATIIGVCAGAKVVAATGLLDGRRATTHWWYLDGMLDRSPTIRYVPDRRIVASDGVVTTTGITASMPMMLTLIEAIAGRERADSVARGLGVPAWDTRHASEAFRLTRPFATTVMGNVLAPWNRETLGLALSPGVDEVSLALVADAWSRTYRSRVEMVDGTVGTGGTGAVESRSGVRIVADRAAVERGPEEWLPAIDDRPPAQALDDALGAIEHRYGRGTADVVAMQLEYPREQ